MNDNETTMALLIPPASVVRMHLERLARDREVLERLLEVARLAEARREQETRPN
jgi:hypothetical protein